MPKVTTIHHGNRIGREGNIRLGCSAIILDETKEKVLLTERADNKQWCLPSGGVDPGETVEEACIREVYEETGLSDETTDFGHFSIEGMSKPDMLLNHKERILDALENSPTAFIK